MVDLLGNPASTVRAEQDKATVHWSHLRHSFPSHPTLPDESERTRMSHLLEAHGLAGCLARDTSANNELPDFANAGRGLSRRRALEEILRGTRCELEPQISRPEFLQRRSKRDGRDCGEREDHQIAGELVNSCRDFQHNASRGGHPSQQEAFDAAH